MCTICLTRTHIWMIPRLKHQNLSASAVPSLFIRLVDLALLPQAPALTAQGDRTPDSTRIMLTRAIVLSVLASMLTPLSQTAQTHGDRLLVGLQLLRRPPCHVIVRICSVHAKIHLQIVMYTCDLWFFLHQLSAVAILMCMYSFCKRSPWYKFAGHNFNTSPFPLETMPQKRTLPDEGNDVSDVVDHSK